MSYLTGDPLAVRIRIAFGASIAANPATWTWTDVTEWWHAPDDVTIGWGRSSGAEQPETSTLSLTLKNSDGRFTSGHPMSPYWPNVRKWTPIQYDIDLGDGAGWRNRFSGFIRKWPLTWPGASSLMALARIEAVGVLGRSGRGKPPARSALRRTIGGTGPLAYWPLEDGSDAGQGGSAVAGVPALTITGTAPFDDIESWTDRQFTVAYGTAALVDVSLGATLTASLPAAVTAATAAGWTAHVACDFPDSGKLLSDFVLLEIDTPGGTYVRWRLVLIQSTYDVQVIAYDAAGTATVVCTDTSPFIGMFTHHLVVWQNGGNISVGYVFDSTFGWQASGSIPGTLAGITAMRVNPTAMTATDPLPAGHLAVWAGQALAALDFDDGPVISALFSHVWTNLDNGAAAVTGEPATRRLARLTAEDGVSLDVPVVDPADEVMMGVQKVGAPLELYQQCEDADQGLIVESGFGLGYLPRVSRYNAPVALTIDAAAGQLGMPFEPVDDDQTLRNRWTVERTDGSTAVAQDDESIDLQGEIEGSDSLNLVDDNGLPDQAGWRLHRSTVQEPRYPALSINLAAHPELAAAWTACKPGSRVQVVNPPAQNVPGVVDQLVVGASETYRGRRSWKATLNVVPASPWQVATADGEQRAPADGTVLAADLAASPVPLNSNPYFETDASGWFGYGATVTRSTAQAHQGAAALLLTPDGVSAQAVADSAQVPVTVGASYIAAAWVRCTVARNVHLGINWYDASHGYLSTSSQPDVPVAANTWTPLSFTAAAPAGAAYASVNAVMWSNPPASHLLYIDEATIAPAATLTMSSTPENGTWTEDPADFPLDLRVGGERVTATAIGPSFVDTFTRTVASGLGTADSGPVWTTSGGAASDYSANGTVGRISNGSVNALRYALVDLGTTDPTFVIDITNPLGTPSGAPVTHWVLVRAADASNYYCARLDINTSGSVDLVLVKRVAGVLSGNLASASGIGTHSASTWRVMVSPRGSTLRAKAWKPATTAEPAWQVEATDTSLTVGTLGGLATRLENGNTNTLPVVVSLDNAQVLNPQQVPLSSRGLSRAWPAGTPVDVWNPAVAPL